MKEFEYYPHCKIRFVYGFYPNGNLYISVDSNQGYGGWQMWDYLTDDLENAKYEKDTVSICNHYSYDNLANILINEGVIAETVEEGKPFGNFFYNFYRINFDKLHEVCVSEDDVKYGYTE